MLITIKFKLKHFPSKKLFQNRKVTIRDNIISFEYVDFNGILKTRDFNMNNILEIVFEE